MDIVLVTGFLGAGKTTRVARWLEQAETCDTALIINEVGQIGLDSVLVAQADNAVQMQLLANGCLCCSAGNNPGPVITQLAMAHRERTGRALQRVVIEASGLARPTQVMRDLVSYHAGYASQLRIVCVVDARRDPVASDEPEAVDQLACADFVVLSRCDLASAKEKADCVAAIARSNPLAVLLEQDDLEAAMAAAHPPTLRFETLVAAPASSRHAVNVIVLHPAPMSARYLVEWMENLSGACGSALLRVKGLIRLEGMADLVCAQSVGGLISPLQRLGALPDVAPFVMVIGRQLNAGLLASCDPDGRFASDRAA